MLFCQILLVLQRCGQGVFVSGVLIIWVLTDNVALLKSGNVCIWSTEVTSLSVSRLRFVPHLGAWCFILCFFTFSSWLGLNTDKEK